MTKYLKCNEKDCRDEWIKYNGDMLQEKLISGEYTEFVLVHCEVNNCHFIYYKGEIGTCCYSCGKEVCSECSVNYMNINENGEYFCRRCNSKNIRIKQQLKKILDE